MSNSVRLGLIFGSISLIFIIVTMTLLGMGAPGIILQLIAGGVAGFIAARKDIPTNKGTGVKAGAISGFIIGGISLIGYPIGDVASFANRAPSTVTYYLQSAYGNVQVSPIEFAINSLFGYHGIVILFFGLIGMVLTGVAGFCGGIIGTMRLTSHPTDH